MAVRLFPGREKYETKSKPESWPVYNEDFIFEIPHVVIKKGKQLSEILNASNFIVFTVYAEEALKKKKIVVGAANWKLDHTLFAHKPHTVDYGDNEELETPDIWRKALELTSGIAGREEKNNQLEVSLRYDPGNPEEGEEDTLVLGTKRFPPSISVHFNPEKDNSILTVPLPSNRDDISCQLSLCTNPAIGKKIVFGRKLIGPNHETFGPAAEHWERAFRTPRVTVTEWHSIR
ncbi:hypothetical protein C0J52_03621 [Blattella germanica]|nr:hypothetical protein C0J52_03621 [Blattella germanica]